VTYAQQITQELEALNYLPAASEYYYDQYSRNDESRFILEKNSWKSIKQNNSSGKYLTDKELEYVALMNGFLKNARFGVEYFTLDFLCSELGVTERHLRRIRTNTSHVFTTKWRKATRSYKGKLENVYAIRPTEHTVFLLGETNYYKSEYNSFVNNCVQNVKLGHQCPTSIYKDENNINIRSRANFIECNFNSQNTSTELVENSSGVAKGISLNPSTDTQTLEQAETLHETQVVETTSPTQPPSTRQREDTPRPSNVVRNGFLGGSKHISEIQPYLTDELCETLRSKSGKLFTNKAIREITKAIAASEKGQYVEFKHVNGVVSYLTPALANEKRDPNKIGGEGYYTLAGMTAEDKLLHERESYLNQVENSGIHTRCDYTQFRARIAGQFPVNLAYDLLTNMVDVKKQENVLKIAMHKLIPLGKNLVQSLLNHAKGIGGYAGVSELEFVGIASNSNYAETIPPVVSPEEPQLPKGIWGKICAAFVSEYDYNLYIYWLAGLEVTEYSEKGIIELRTSSGMVRDRIEQAYLPFLSKVAKGFGIIAIEVNNFNI
jgi:hypothetical protein